MRVDLKEIEMLNRRANELNAERQKLIGKQEVAKNEYDKAVLAYEKKYGVKLDFNNLQDEYNKVSTELSKSVEVLKEQIRVIESGEYKTANDNSKIDFDMSDINVNTSNINTGVAESVVKPIVDVGAYVVNEVDNGDDESNDVFTPSGWGIPNKVEVNNNFGQAIKFDE